MMAAGFVWFCWVTLLSLLPSTDCFWLTPVTFRIDVNIFYFHLSPRIKVWQSTSGYPLEVLALFLGDCQTALSVACRLRRGRSCALVLPTQSFLCCSTLILSPSYWLKMLDRVSGEPLVYRVEHPHFRAAADAQSVLRGCLVDIANLRDI